LTEKAVAVVARVMVRREERGAMVKVWKRCKRGAVWAVGLEDDGSLGCDVPGQIGRLSAHKLLFREARVPLSLLKTT
jgi:hypothetical protein